MYQLIIKTEMNKKIYQIPTLEVEVFVAEQGFALSSAEGGFNIGDGGDFTEEDVNW